MSKCAAKTALKIHDRLAEWKKFILNITLSAFVPWQHEAPGGSGGVNIKIGVIEGMVHPVQMGKRTRMSFARIEEALAVPDLIEVQKNSYQYFLKEGLREVLADVSPITDYSESLILEFMDYSLDDKPKYTVEKCKERDATYAAPLKVTVRLTNRDTHEIKESEVFMGDFPLMTEHGTFIINGAERVIVSQLVQVAGRVLFQGHR